MTQRFYYTDSYLTVFDAQVVEASPDGLRVYLDRTAFYPTSGGQPFDLGTLNGAAVADVVDEEDRIAHVLTAPVAVGAVAGRIDWARRFDHMQQHTGQHLLSAVFEEVLGASTVSFHLGVDSATIDLAAAALDPASVQAVERRANEAVFENRAVTVTFEDAAEVQGLRKASERAGTLRIVSIDGLDRSACGGTHVRATGEIGPVLIRKLDKVRGNVRVEFLCGFRAVKRARADFEALGQIARAFSAPVDETPGFVFHLLERAAESDKQRKRLSAELAAARGRERFQNTPADSAGVRRTVLEVESIGEDARAEATAFVGSGKGAILVWTANPPSVLLAASKDSGVNAGQWLKTALAEAGGRGGGSPAMAQGSVPADKLGALLNAYGAS